mmetsp:Transcript_5985/g.14562  ORF Transcript_5985/g.14562 Transcript_5985/m.14562 type:complete len:226 (+) Transcript_5985:1226-1903(+)
MPRLAYALADSRATRRWSRMSTRCCWPTGSGGGWRSTTLRCSLARGSCRSDCWRSSARATARGLIAACWRGCSCIGTASGTTRTFRTRIGLGPRRRVLSPCWRTSCGRRRLRFQRALSSRCTRCRKETIALCGSFCSRMAWSPSPSPHGWCARNCHGTATSSSPTACPSATSTCSAPPPWTATSQSSATAAPAASTASSAPSSASPSRRAAASASSPATCPSSTT